ncbi:hypothetical protein AUJ84_00195 [Candidatus Pacearchaeota archaeon CG1_02_32_132]|nr:MAG: hypothetical protein AUJ84_00195 [Candidatus Pacearchaeota archaeon CG1_02_32_132]
MKKNIALFEIFILIMSGVAFSYFIHESSNGLEISGEGKGISWLREKILGYLSNGLVSAQEQGLWTCPRDNNGSLCQEYPAETCEELCAGDCIPARRQNTQECKLGTCQDTGEGTCSAQTPRLACEESGGIWTEEEPAQCKPGCCLIGGNANFITEQSCGVLGDRLGQQGEWKQVDNELECLILADNQEEGACVLNEIPGEGFNCKFTDKGDCLTKGGEFYSGLLCTNPSLNTICQRTRETSCSPGKDEVYFLDSCGNKGNIYDTNKKNDDEYWNRVFGKSETCTLDGNLGNQNACGNCDYFLGNTCGIPGEGDAKPLDGEYVCKDLSCTDEWNDERKNGESWCAYDSQIGVDSNGQGNKGRSVDLPGSGSYRKVCLDGEVRTESCADFRNEICSESRDEEVGFSSAACRINRWQECIAANSDKDKLNKCESNSDCFLKEVRLDKFKFDICAPKYPEGFNLKADFGGEVGQSICGLGTQKCKVIQQKGFGGWKNVANGKCLEPDFAQTMNNLCTSLGDCGGDVNIQGQFTSDGYSVKNSPKLSQGYISGLRDYIEPIKGQHADPLTKDEIAALFGLDPSDPKFENRIGETLGKLGLGATGVLFAIGYFSGGFAGSTIGGIIATIGGGAWEIGLGGYSGVLAGAVIGAAAGFIISKLFGLEGEGALVVSLVGIVAGGYLGLNIVTTSGAFANPGLIFGQFLLPLLIILIIIAIIIKLLGIGDTRTINVAFTCNPWQPPIGGKDCETCTEGDLPCSEYKCQSLGQTCEFVNEGTSEEACINVAPDDTLAPRISPNYEVISEGFEYAEVTDRSFKIENSESECIPAYTQVIWGVSLNEHGQCKYDTERMGFDDMEFYFGESSLFKKNHITALSLPSLESLGEGGFDPNRRADFDLYVRCQDGSGNKNDDDFTVRFCISPEDDTTPPILQKFNPESPAYVSLDATELNLTFYTNEPADCRYSLTDNDYETMQNQIDCANNVSDMTLFGFECLTTLPVAGDENYYLRCKDKPWAEEGERNANSQSVNYEIIQTTDPLIIESVEINPEPVNGLIKTGGRYVSVDLTVTTSGGAPVNRYCTYGFGGDNNLARFFESGGDIHRQTFSSLFEGNYDIGIRCEDDVGNFAQDSVQFDIEVDNVGPTITRVYSQNSLLYIITNEDSMCSYSHNSCNFGFDDEDVSEMSGDELIHSADFNSNLNYYVKCKDEYSNVGECLTVRAGY